MSDNTQLSNFEKYKAILPEVAEKFAAMTKEELLEACCGEGLDAIAMQERVSFFMQECTNNMSKTNYTIESLKALVEERKEADIDDFCAYLIEDDASDKEILKTVKERGNKSLGS